MRSESPAPAAPRAPHTFSDLSLTAMDRLTFFSTLTAVVLCWMPHGVIHQAMQQINPGAPSPLHAFISLPE